MTHAVPLAVIAAYIAAMFIASWYSQKLMQRGVGGTVGFLLAGRSFPAWIAAALLAGLAVGGASTVGAAELAYVKGFSAGWYNAAWAFGALVMGLGAARKYRQAGFTTLPELFERCYGKTAMVLGATGQIAIQIVITSLQYIAGGAVLTALLPGVFSFRVGMIITAVVFVAITLIGGFWAAGVTNVVNVAVIYLGIGLGVAFTLGRVGGLSGIAHGLPQGHPGFDLAAVGSGVIAAWFLVMVTQAHSTQAVVQIGLAAKDSRAAGRGYLWGALLILPVGFLSAILGMAAAVMYPGIVPTEALPRVVLQLPPLVAGLVLAGLWAADVSTASALLIGGATLVSNDIVKKLFAAQLSPAQDQLVCRGAVLGISVLTLILALQIEGILNALLVGLTLSTAYTLIAVATLFAPRLCRKGSASWTLGATMGALAVWMLLPAQLRFLPHPIYWTWTASCVAFLAVALVDRRGIQVPPGATHTIARGEPRWEGVQ